MSTGHRQSGSPGDGTLLWTNTTETGALEEEEEEEEEEKEKTKLTSHLEAEKFRFTQFSSVLINIYTEK